ncbi:3-ketosteroid-delta-1-dehydrogenase [Rhodococcus ruber BKS 20-38]|uniref:3-oxosteroid 1-dehydrogenase n=1 Tax=Rhodococcus ruber BKS 20-38 TaxID=1278076 RepID=M3A389_9NOCA|nr:FAD-binding protein [Rhodococcus ruber]EME67363.1 3-ketosteroid-delta-1-dehydrogenase [Rhodococcus ruber BKS 20-38]
MAKVEEVFDLVIVGSGGGGLVAALAAADSGLRPVVLEKQELVGGSTAMSGGVIWMPNNPLMREEGVPDSRDSALAYFQAVVGDPDEGSSLARRSTFLDRGSEMIQFLRDKGVELVRCEGYADYYDLLDGGSRRGRAVEPKPWDGKRLGEWYTRINPGFARGIGLAVKTNETRKILSFHRSPRTFATTTRVFLRTVISRALGKDLFANGMSLIAQLTRLTLDAGVPIWTGAGVDELLVEDGAVVGVVLTHNGVRKEIRARRGVLLAAGGFERNPDMRRKYTEKTQPNDGEWTAGSQGNTGEVLAAAIALGAKTDYMDEAIWQPSPRSELAVSTLAVARQWPNTIFVNQQGKRFCNESNSYIEVGRAMYAHDATPAWLIFDDRYRRNAEWGFGLPRLKDWKSAIPGNLPEEWVSKGWIRRADTIEDLARQIGIDPQQLCATIEKFNAAALEGRDPEFGRGESQYNKELGDPGNKVNPAVGPLNTGPYYATEIYPGDVGTAGGVVTNEHAQVIDGSNAPIPGLYATGNMTATVMGRYYLGAGSSIANTMVFGYVAALHAKDPKNAVVSSELAS